MTGVDTCDHGADHFRHHDKRDESNIVQLVVARD